MTKKNLDSTIFFNWRITITIFSVFLIGIIMAGCKNSQENKPSTALAFVVLNDLNLSLQEKMEASLKKYLNTLNLSMTDFSLREEMYYFQVNNYQCTIGLIKQPIPWRELEGPCETSWMFKDAAEKMKSHQAHLVVAILGEMKTIQERTLILTKIIAAAVERHNAAGVYYGNGGLVHSPNYFCDEAMKASRDDLPLSLWIDFRLMRNSDQTCNLITTGLDVFDCMEIEILESNADPDDMLSMATGTAWLLLNGERIKMVIQLALKTLIKKLKPLMRNLSGIVQTKCFVSGCKIA